MSFVQTINPQIQLTGQRDPPFPDRLSVTNLQVERVFGGGGSKAKVEIVLDDWLREEQRQAIRQGVRPSEALFYDYPTLSGDSVPTATRELQDARDEIDPNLEGADANEFVSSAVKREFDLTLEIDIEVTLAEGGTTKRRIFTGSLTKVTENQDRVVKMHALDRRLELNRNSVFLDTDGNTVPELIHSVLGGYVPSEGKDVRRGGLGMEAGEDYYIHLNGTDPVVIEDRAWGVKTHATVFEFLQDLAHKQGATIHIDRFNRIHFIVGNPGGNRTWRSSSGPWQIPPIVSWENAEEEDEVEIIGESRYDETGLGTYSAVDRDSLQEVVDSPMVSASISQNNTLSRTALRNEIDSLILQEELMRDSGVMRVVGDPRIQPYDTFSLDNQTNDAFTPIGRGNHMTKRVKHIINSREGYITEVRLGKDPEELFARFTGQYADVSTEGVDKDNESESDGPGYPTGPFVAP